MNIINFIWTEHWNKFLVRNKLRRSFLTNERKLCFHHKCAEICVYILLMSGKKNKTQFHNLRRFSSKRNKIKIAHEEALLGQARGRSVFLRDRFCCRISESGWTSRPPRRVHPALQITKRWKSFLLWRSFDLKRWCGGDLPFYQSARATVGFPWRWNLNWWMDLITDWGELRSKHTSLCLWTPHSFFFFGSVGPDIHSFIFSFITAIMCRVVPPLIRRSWKREKT